VTPIEPTTSTSDPFEVSRSISGDDGLRPFSEATVLDAADIHTATTLGRLAGGADDQVLLAAALAVRAVRLGHVYVDLATVAAQPELAAHLSGW